jgi:hypothetical protein
MQVSYDSRSVEEYQPNPASLSSLLGFPLFLSSRGPTSQWTRQSKLAPHTYLQGNFHGLQLLHPHPSWNITLFLNVFRTGRFVTPSMRNAGSDENACIGGVDSSTFALRRTTARSPASFILSSMGRVLLKCTAKVSRCFLAIISAVRRTSVCSQASLSCSSLRRVLRISLDGMATLSGHVLARYSLY